MESVFLACFAFGALFTLASFAFGAVGGGLHLGGGHLHIGGSHAGLGDAAHAAAGHHAPGHSGTGHSANGRAVGLPVVNASSLIGGLTWFGAAGYLLLRLGQFALPLIVLVALAIGAIGWYLVARFLGLLLAGEVEMNPDDYRLEGTVGQVTVGIPAGGTGEVVFTKVGARRSEAARAVDGRAIPRGSEVVITAYADGFATVQPWSEFLAERDSVSATHKKEA